MIEARIGSSPRRLGKIKRLSGKGYNPRVAVGADGTVAVQWSEPAGRRSSRMRVAVAPPGRNFGRRQIVERRSANQSPIGLAIQPNGRVVAVWQRSRSRVGYAVARRGHGFGRPRNLASTFGSSGFGASLAVDERDGAVLFSLPTPPGPAVRTLGPSSSSFSSPTIVPTTGGDSVAGTALVSGGVADAARRACMIRHTPPAR